GEFDRDPTIGFAAKLAGANFNDAVETRAGIMDFDGDRKPGSFAGDAFVADENIKLNVGARSTKGERDGGKENCRETRDRAPDRAAHQESSHKVKLAVACAMVFHIKYLDCAPLAMGFGQASAAF